MFQIISAFFKQLFRTVMKKLFINYYLQLCGKQHRFLKNKQESLSKLAFLPLLLILIIRYLIAK